VDERKSRVGHAKLIAKYMRKRQFRQLILQG